MMIPTQNNSNHIAESEISKIFIGLNLFTFEGSQQIILEKFKNIQPKLHENNKYRDPKLLIPIIIYVYFRLFGYKINKSDLLAVSNISSADFNDFIMQLKKYLECYKEELKKRDFKTDELWKNFRKKMQVIKKNCEISTKNNSTDC